jgi:hypothetical protein
MLQDQQYLDDTRQGGLGVGDTKEIKNINHDQGV